MDHGKTCDNVPVFWRFCCQALCSVLTHVSGCLGRVFGTGAEHILKLSFGAPLGLQQPVTNSLWLMRCPCGSVCPVTLGSNNKIRCELLTCLAYKDTAHIPISYQAASLILLHCSLTLNFLASIHHLQTMISWLLGLDVVLGLSFVLGLFYGPRLSVWIARYFLVRCSWYGCAALMLFELVHILRRVSLGRSLAWAGLWILLLTTISALQLVLLRLGDRWLIAQHCDDSFTVYDAVHSKMGNSSNAVIRHLSPMSRQLNASYCNLDMILQNLYSSKSISRMEEDQIHHETLCTTRVLRNEMRRRCALPAGIGWNLALQEADARGSDLTRLVHSIAAGQWAYVQPYGPLSASRNLGLASVKLYAILESLLPEPGFWDEPRELPSLDFPTHRLVDFYPLILRPILTHHLLPSSFRFPEYIIHTWFTNAGYLQARQAMYSLMEAADTFRDALEEYHQRRCGCQPWDPPPLDCDLQHDLQSYQNRYLPLSSEQIFVDRAPIDKTISLRRQNPPCNASRSALIGLSTAWQYSKRQVETGRPLHCAAIVPLPRHVKDLWRTWWFWLDSSPPTVYSRPRRN